MLAVLTALNSHPTTPGHAMQPRMTSVFSELEARKNDTAARKAPRDDTDAVMGALYFTICHDEGAVLKKPFGSFSEGMDWMNLPHGTHLLLWGTSHMSAVAQAMRVAARGLGILEKSEILSHSNVCANPDDLEPADSSCQITGNEECDNEMRCGPNEEPCDLRSHSILRDYLVGGSTITSVSNHVQSQRTSEAIDHWMQHILPDGVANFTHGAFMSPHTESWIKAQCKKQQSHGNEVPDPTKVGDEVEPAPCTGTDGPDCPTRRDSRFAAFARWVAQNPAVVFMPQGDDVPLQCVTDEQLATKECGGARNSTVWLRQAYDPSVAFVYPAQQPELDCHCSSSHLCSATCGQIDGAPHCKPAVGVAGAWLVLRAAGLA